MRPYNPTKRIASILNWTLEKVKEVPYRVPTRWAFYRCVQERGLGKEDYAKFKKWTSKARKRFWNGWRPYTLEDDSRKIDKRGGGFRDFENFITGERKRSPVYDKFITQDNIVLVWFEAIAMRSQFRYYTGPHCIPLVPFRGDIGPDYKWDIASYLDDLNRRYPDKPIVVLYFGDYEPHFHKGSLGKGIRIPLDALKDIRPWFNALQSVRGVHEDDLADIKYKRCGLDPEHIKKYGIPENPKREGEFQWEALDDEMAKEVILKAIGEYWDFDAIKKIKHQEKMDFDNWRDRIEDAFTEYEFEDDDDEIEEVSK